MTQRVGGLSLAPFRATRFDVPAERLGGLVCPPYDVIDDAERSRLLATDADNAVGLILPSGDDAYRAAADRLDEQLASGLLEVDAAPALYVYEMATADGGRTRGLVGAVELHDYADGVILPHENTMAGPVADRLALMLATQANLEPIYLAYDGGGEASRVVADADQSAPIARAVTADGTEHRLWAVTDPAVHAAVDADLTTRRALIADGHHRYATYLEMQRLFTADRGAGPWDRGLTLLVDSSTYGPQVHAIHRVLTGVPFGTAVQRAAEFGRTSSAASVAAALEQVEAAKSFALVLTDGDTAVLYDDPSPAVRAAAVSDGEPAALGELDVTVLHRGMLGIVWGLEDNVDTVGYAHSADEAITAARSTGGTAILLRPTPVAAVAAVAAAGGRMPRKSTLFTPKPASGLLLRRFVDQGSS